jgi:hypothetical protein
MSGALQWDDGTWSDATSGAGVYYNVWRFLEPQTGRYTRTDPVKLGVLESARRPQELPVDGLGAYYLAMLRTGIPVREHPYLYGAQNPLLFSDPLGLFGPGALVGAGGVCVVADGPLPIGDAVAAVLVISVGLNPPQAADDAVAEASRVG